MLTLLDHYIKKFNNTESLPVLLTIVIILTISSQRGFWKRKIDFHLKGYTSILAPHEVEHIKSIVEDISTSIGFITSILSILLSLLIFFFKSNELNIIINPIIKIEIIVYFILIIIPVIVLFRMQAKQMNDHLTKFPFRRYSFKKIFDILLIALNILFLFIINQ